MKITFLTEKTPDSSCNDGREKHSVLIDDKTVISQWEDIEPEDCYFYRDLASPHDCDTIIQQVIMAVKNGEEIDIEYVNEDF